MLSKETYLAALNLIMGYNQFDVMPANRYKTAFITHKILFVYNVMPFGLCNAPATFQRLMERIIGPLVGDRVLVYLDDILIFSASVDVLFETLEQVLGLLTKANLKCEPSKCSLYAETIHYLGHVVSNASILLEQTELDRIQQWQLPTTI